MAVFVKFYRNYEVREELLCSYVDLRSAKLDHSTQKYGTSSYIAIGQRLLDKVMFIDRHRMDNNGSCSN